MKYLIIAVIGVLFLTLLGDYIFYLLAFLLGAAALWGLYRAAISYQEWKMPQDKWLAKIEAEELRKEQKLEQKKAAAKHDDEKQTETDEKDNAEEPKRDTARHAHRHSRPKQTKADGFAVGMFVFMALVFGWLSSQAVSLHDGGGSSSSAPVSNFTVGSTAVQGATVSGRRSSPSVAMLAAGLGSIFLGATGGIASIVIKKRCPQYVKPLTGAAATFLVLGCGCLAYNLTGSAGNRSAETSAGSSASAVVESSGGESGGAASEGQSVAASDDKTYDTTTVVEGDEILFRQDKDAVKKYISRENPFAKLNEAKAQSGLKNIETADDKILQRYLVAVGKLSEGSLDPQRIIKGAEETAKIYEDFYGSEFLIVTERYQAKMKHEKPDDIVLAELMKKRDTAEKEIRRLAEWSGVKETLHK